MKVEVIKKVNKDKSITITINFEQVLPLHLLKELEESGITDTRSEVPLVVGSYKIRKGVGSGTISSTTYP